MIKRDNLFISRLRQILLHHKALSFVVILILTVLLVRLMTSIYDPNPLLFGFELHHFDYGLILLIMSSVLLLFDPKRHLLYLCSTAISLALVLDQYWYIRGYPHGQNILSVAYSSTLESGVIVVCSFVILFLIVYLVANYKPK